MRLLIKISGLLSVALLSISLTAQQTDCQINKSYPAWKSTCLSISNKYGNINILNVGSDSLFICATITVVHNDQEMVNKSINLINVNVQKLKDTISVTTEYDKNFFSAPYVRGRKSFNVDFLIRIPAQTNVNITNGFGNVTIEELSGVVDVKLSNGIFTAKKLARGNIKPLNSISVDHGEIYIDESNWISLTSINCPSVNLNNVQALVISSISSKIKIGEIRSMVSNSKYDKYIIESVNNMESESRYSQYEIEKLYGQFKSKAAYGSIMLDELMKEFRMIDIISAYNTLSIKIKEDVSFKADLVSTNTPVDINLDNFPGITKSEKNNVTILSGTTGDNKNTNALIKMQTTFGKLSIQKK